MILCSFAIIIPKPTSDKRLTDCVLLLMIKFGLQKSNFWWKADRFVIFRLHTDPQQKQAASHNIAFLCSSAINPNSHTSHDTYFLECCAVVNVHLLRTISALPLLWNSIVRPISRNLIEAQSLANTNTTSAFYIMWLRWQFRCHETTRRKRSIGGFDNKIKSTVACYFPSRTGRD